MIKCMLFPGGVIMATKTVRYTATLPLDHINELRGLAKEKKIPSVNYAINAAFTMTATATRRKIY